MDWDVLRSSGNFRILLHELYSPNSFKVSRSRCDRPGLGLSLTDVSPERNFEYEFLSCFCSVFLILYLPQHYKNINFQIPHFTCMRSCTLFTDVSKNHAISG